MENLSYEEALKIADEAVRKTDYDPRAVASPLRVVYLIGQLDFEVTVGGVLQWLTNSSGRYGSETVDALETIRASEVAAIVKEILGFFPSGAPSDDDAVRTREVELLRPAAEAAWRDLGDRLLEWPDDIDALLRAFVSAHESEFRRAIIR